MAGRHGDDACLDDRAALRARVGPARLAVESRADTATTAYLVIQILVAVERCAGPGRVARLHVPAARVLMGEAPQRHRRPCSCSFSRVAESRLTLPDPAGETLMLGAGPQPDRQISRTLLVLCD